MAKPRSDLFPYRIPIDRLSDVPLYEQIYDSIRHSILSGRLEPGFRLSSTRALAEDIGVSRNIVVLAFERLLNEGYLEAKVGAGTTVARTMPDEFLHVGRRTVQVHPAPARKPLSKRGRKISSLAAFPKAPAPAARNAPFQYGLPALDQLPLELWGRLVARHFRKASKELLGPGNSAGLWELREAIAAYVGMARGVRCRPGQVIVVNGSQQAIDLTARVLLDAGDLLGTSDHLPGAAEYALAFQIRDTLVGVPGPWNRRGMV